jgi:hypothetical protein
MLRAWLIGATLLAVAGCATATLPYTPEQPPPGVRVSAAYQLLGDRLRVELDSDGRAVEEVTIVRPDGSPLRPLAIETMPVGPGSPPVGVGVGVGGTRWGGRGVGVGTGVSVGIPIGGGRPDTNTFAYFPIDEAGPAPWRVRVKLAGIEPTTILVGAAPAGTVR